MSTLVPGSSPEVSAAVFNGQPEDYWVGRIAAADPDHQTALFDATAWLRARTYLDLGYVTPDRLDDQGREIDQDDQRSVHFTVVERSADNGRADLVGCSRLIVKDQPDKPLPIERYFPEVFEGHPVPTGAVEVSRLIASHNSGRTRHKIALSLIRAMTRYAVAEGIDESYCIVEEPLLRLLGSVGVPTVALAEPKFVEEQGGLLWPVRIEHTKIIDPDYLTDLGKAAITKFFLDGSANRVEGFYNETFQTERAGELL